MSIDVLLTCPHGEPEHNDVIAPEITLELAKLLSKDRYKVKALINQSHRYHCDMNRKEGRDTKFRNDIVKKVLDGVRLLVDVHSFPMVGGSGRFTGMDIVLLHTPGIQNMRFYKSYVSLMAECADKMGEDVKLGIMPSERVNDINIEAWENGQPSDSLMLAEHNESGDERLYAELHQYAIRVMLGKPRKARIK